MLRRPWAAATALLLALLLCSPALAANTDPANKFRAGEHVVVRAGETIPHDLYVAADRLTVDGSIDGDLYAAARTVEIRGSVAGELTLVSEDVQIDGTVGGNVHLLAGRLRLRGSAEKDLLGTALSLKLEPGGRIGGDLIYAALQAEIDGTVSGGLLSPEHSRVPPSGAPLLARRYSRAPGAIAGLSPPAATGSSGGVGGAFRTFLLRMFVLVVAGLLLLWLARRSVWTAAGLAPHRPFGSAAAALLTSAAATLIVLILAAALFALLLLLFLGGDLGTQILVVLLFIGSVFGGGMLIVLFAGAVVLIALTTISLALGRALLSRMRRPLWLQRVLALLAGAALVTLVLMLPWPGAVGGLLWLLAIVLGFGAFVLGYRNRQPFASLIVPVAAASIAVAPPSISVPQPPRSVSVNRHVPLPLMIATFVAMAVLALIAALSGKSGQREE